MTWIDSGLLLKLYINEPGSAELMDWLLSHPDDSVLIVTPFHEAEIANALAQKAARKDITAAQERAAWRDFTEDIAAGRFQQPHIEWPEVFHRSVELGRAHTAASRCRTLDSIHAAGAEAHATLLLSFDGRQIALAKAANIPVVNPL